MAKVKTQGIRISGKLGDKTYVEGPNGNMYVRTNTSLDKERVMTDPAFEGSRAAMARFGRASAIGKAIRMALLPYSRDAADRTFPARLNKQVLAVLHKLPNDHPVFHTTGFDNGLLPMLAPKLGCLHLHKDKSVFPWLDGPLKWERTDRAVRFRMPGVSFSKNLQRKSGATHYNIVLHLTNVDPDNPQTATYVSPWHPIHQSQPTNITLHLDPDTEGPAADTFASKTHFLVALGIQAAIECSDIYYEVQTIHAMSIVGMV